MIRNARLLEVNHNMMGIGGWKRHCGLDIGPGEATTCE